MGFSNVRGVPRWGEGSSRGAAIIDGKAVAAEVRARVATEVARRVAGGGSVPGLATILVGDDEASKVYVAAKHRACEQAGIRSFEHWLSGDCQPRELEALIEDLNGDPGIDGILLQLPLPAGLDGARFVDLIDPRKDVDGLSSMSTGALWRSRPGLAPCTPSGVMALLDHAGVELGGAAAVIVGRSELVGKPLAAMLLSANATVTICHRHSRDLERTCRGADVLVVACGVPELIGAEHIKPGAVVIDVGINRIDGGLVGDVQFDAALALASALTPVPGGVGPTTIAYLLENTLQAAALASG